MASPGISALKARCSKLGIRRAVGRDRGLNLALQGGGSHGAFTWGVLDRLLEDDRIRIGAASGASAGAINAVTLAAGLTSGGRDDARTLLEAVWSDIAKCGQTGAAVEAAMTGLPNGSNGMGLHQMALGVFLRLFSPYQFNPFNLNPLRTILNSRIDFERLGRESPLPLVIGATDLESAKPRLFRTREITADAVLASCCLPQLFQAIKIDGGHYWDGGYSANPPLLPLIREGAAGDTLIVQLSPDAETDVPGNAQQIAARVHQIVFSQPLRMELEAVAFARRLSVGGLPLGSRESRRIAGHRLHRISAGEHAPAMANLPQTSTDWGAIKALRDGGRAAAEAWLDEHFPCLGRRSSFDLPEQQASP